MDYLVNNKPELLTNYLLLTFTLHVIYLETGRKEKSLLTIQKYNAVNM